jgi:signal transduction histidine kinase
MRLADFIRRDMEAILAQWEAFAAAQLPAAASMKSLALRDHAQQILEAVADDIERHQTREAQAQKSKGRAPLLMDTTETAAQTHALLRARNGFNINQMAAEYRALRASVLRLWADACEPAGTDLDDMLRFNEGIDQAIAESVGFFSAQVDQARNLLLGMLGHDMRSPLHAIQVTAAYLARLNAGVEVSVAATRLIKSGARINALLDDLLDFNRTKLGLGINVVPTEVDLAEVFADELQQLRVAHPGRQLELQVNGDVRGVWDENRLHQLLGNLVLNALKYGSSDTPVRVVVTGMPGDVLFSVANRGPMIEPSTLDQLFDPLKRGLQQAGSGVDDSLGLGLFICREIASAHGGEIGAHSDESETVFTVRLPRIAAKP